MNASVRVNEDGQVRLPQDVRDQLGIGPGSRVEFRLAADGSIVIQRADGTRPRGRFDDLIGVAGPGMSTDELMELLRGKPE